MNTKSIMIPATFALAVIILAFFFSGIASAQETQYTRCVNGKGQVVIVTNFTCPPGYWRT